MLAAVQELYGERAASARADVTALLASIDARLAASPDLALVQLFVYGVVALEASDPLSAGAAPERTQLLRDALEIGTRLEPPMRDALCLAAATQLAEYVRKDGDLEGVVSLLDDALTRHPAPTLERVAALTVQADAERQLGVWPDSERHLLEAQRFLERSRGEDPRAHIAWFNLAGVAFQLRLDCGLLDEAGAWLEREETYAQYLGPSAERELGLLLSRVHLEIATVRREAAVERMERALADPELFAANPEYRARLAVRLGVALNELERFDAAREPRARAVLERALEVPALDSGDRQLSQETLLDVYFRDGDLARVEALLESAGRSLPSDDGPGRTLERAELAGLIAAWRARVACARGLSEAELERSRQELERAYAAVLTSWAGQPRGRSGLGFLVFSRRRAILDVLVELALRLDGPERGPARALELVTRWQDLGTLVQKLEPVPWSIEDLRGSLVGEGRALLVFVPGDGVTHLFGVERERVRHWPLPAKYQLEARVLELQRELSHPPADARDAASRARISVAARALREALLPEDALDWAARWRGMYVVGAELLGGAPLELLEHPAGGTLGTRTALAYLPSLPAGLGLERRARSRGDERSGIDLRMLAAPAHANTTKAKGARFTLSDESARLLREPFDPARVDLWSGAEATLERLDPARPARILHLMTHGLYDPERVLPAGLALEPSEHDDGLLWCDELEDGSVAARLVLLSACGAARGPSRQGDDGVAHLGGAFLAAGADCVVLSRFDVDAAATVELMISVHARLAAGDAPAEALRAARERLAADPRFDHPFYAGGLQAFGLGHRPVF